MHVRLPCTPASPGLAREFVLGALEREGKSELGEVATLLVSELVTNAFLHARSEVEVDVKCDRKAVAVAVSDASTRPARAQDPTSERGGTGRGLQLVAALADDWGSEVNAHGKTVWFSIQENGSGD